MEINEVDPEGNMGSNGYLRNIGSFQALVSISFNDNVKDATVYGGNSFGSYSEVAQYLDAEDYDFNPRKNISKSSGASPSTGMTFSSLTYVHRMAY